MNPGSEGLPVLPADRNSPRSAGLRGGVPLLVQRDVSNRPDCAMFWQGGADMEGRPRSRTLVIVHVGLDKWELTRP
jgi:hypothetical protein